MELNLSIDTGLVRKILTGFIHSEITRTGSYYRAVINLSGVVLIGVPLGIMARKGGFGIAATLSLGFFLFYWAFLIGGEKLADRDITSPFIGMWSANILLGIFGIYLTIRIGRETVVIDWSIFQRWIPKRWRARLLDEPDAAIGDA